VARTNEFSGLHVQNIDSAVAADVAQVALLK
jgi:hypothetical protein